MTHTKIVIILGSYIYWYKIFIVLKSHFFQHDKPFFKKKKNYSKMIKFFFLRKGLIHQLYYRKVKII
jgi:hypothetical protein